MAHDKKYGTIIAEHGHRHHGTVGVPLNESDELVFVIRAQDKFAVAAVDAYAEIVEAGGVAAEVVASVRAVAEGMAEWQHGHRDLVKAPD